MERGGKIESNLALGAIDKKENDGRPSARTQGREVKCVGEEKQVGLRIRTMREREIQLRGVSGKRQRSEKR